MAKKSITIEVEGLKELAKRLSGISAEAKTKATTQINLAALDFQLNVRKTISKTTGRHRKYKRGKTQVAKGLKRVHYSSSPGKPPNSDSGKLRESLSVTKASAFRTTAFVRAGGSGAKYAPFVERGTRRMKARPYFRPMLRKLTPQIVRRIERAINSVL